MEMKLESIILSEKTQHKWLSILWFLLYEIFRIGKLIESEGKLFIDELENRGNEWLINFCGVSFWGNQNVLELYSADICTALNLLFKE